MKLVQSVIRLVGTGSALLPSLALLLGGFGLGMLRLLPPPAAPHHTSRAAPGPEMLEIDRVLAERAPDLGLALRNRVAQAIIEESEAADLDPLFVLGLIAVESDFTGDAVSYAGARGLMQLRPVTAAYLAETEGLKLTTEEIYRDPAVQVQLGVRYLARMQKRFGSLDLALMAYNAGPEKLRQSLAAGDIERFRGYPRAVRRSYERFRVALRLDSENALAQAELPFEREVR